MKLYRVTIQKGELFSGWNGTEWSEHVAAGSIRVAESKALRAARRRINLHGRQYFATCPEGAAWRHRRRGDLP